MVSACLGPKTVPFLGITIATSTGSWPSSRRVAQTIQASVKSRWPWGAGGSHRSKEGCEFFPGQKSGGDLGGMLVVAVVFESDFS